MELPFGNTFSWPGPVLQTERRKPTSVDMPMSGLALGQHRVGFACTYRARRVAQNRTTAPHIVCPVSAVQWPCEPLPVECTVMIATATPATYALRPVHVLASDSHCRVTARRISTLFVAGCTTSGCVRASVVDAMSWGFRPVVLADCVGDRAIGPHHAALFDLQAKYADVRPWSDVAAQL